MTLLQEATDLFRKCLLLQESQYYESQAQAAMPPQEPPDDFPEPEEGGVSLSGPESEAPQDERWATIIEPVTSDTLLDTLLSQLQTLTTLCGLVNVDEGRGFATVDKYSMSEVDQKLQTYLKDTDDREQEAGLIRSTFSAALADASFRLQRIDIGTYERTLNDAFAALSLDNDPEGLCNKAEAFIAYNTAMRTNFEAAQSPDVSASRWKVLSAALNNLTKASKLPAADNLPKIHLVRGDVELLRFQLGQAPSNYDIASKNGAILVKNAEKFYRGAAALARSDGSRKEQGEAEVKEALALSLSGEPSKLLETVKSQPELVRGILEDGIDDGLVSYEALSTMGIA